MPYLFILLNVADAALTVIGIMQGKRELNPVLQWLMEQIGLLSALVLVKSVTVGIVLAVATRVQLLLPIGCIAVTGAVLWNVMQLVG